MTVNEIRRKYLHFFEERGHVVIPPVPVVPENDPTTLFISSGMQPLLPYFLGTPHPQGSRVVNVQPSFRAEDIEEIGDNRHTTTFEMLGNWSFGDYFKKEQLQWFFEFLTDVIGLDPRKLYVTVFAGDTDLNIPQDDESINVWRALFSEKKIEAKEIIIGSAENGYTIGMQNARIFAYDAKKNWWSRSGLPANMPIGEPGGPDSEVFYDFETPHNKTFGVECHPNCDCGRFIEIGNSVFMQYIKNADGTFGLLPKANVDFGGGLERIAAATVGKGDVFLINTLLGTINELAHACGKRYDDPKFTRSFRIVADHLKGAIFMIADGVIPSNTEQGYILRRLLRRVVVHLDTLHVTEENLVKIIDQIMSAYQEAYPKLATMQSTIMRIITDEEKKFRKTLANGMKKFEMEWKGVLDEKKGDVKSKTLAGHAELILSGETAFDLFSTNGFPIELTVEIAQERGGTVDIEDFKKRMEKHQELSRTGAEQKFKGGLADNSEKTTMLHTATHLMLAGLRKYLGDHVHQAGSNITAERTRFDFTHGEKVEAEILRKVEHYVNDVISKKCTISIEQMPKEIARSRGVEGSFWDKYPEIVNVYVARDSDGTLYSSELCGGPHVGNTADILGTFKIVKEEASSAGVRRIKAILI